jgi:hypothetical protein
MKGTNGRSQNFEHYSVSDDSEDNSVRRRECVSRRAGASATLTSFFDVREVCAGATRSIRDVVLA